MPAIQPARLKQQAVLLAQQFDNPVAYVRSLHHLLDFYADRAHRPGQSGKPAPLTSAYRVHPPVLRQILQELAPYARENANKALDLCDALWAQPYLEFRQLAAALLGQISGDYATGVIERIRMWARKDTEKFLLEALLGGGLERQRIEAPQAVFKLIEDWLASPDTFQQQLGLMALLPAIQQPDFENLPIFFRLIHPLVRSAPSGLRPDVLDVLEALARRSPQETAYFLRQTLSLPNCPDTPWMIRQSLHAFPIESQQSLRSALRSVNP